ncbi:uncharacterized protein V6R79_022438 [Siganus canaliculatus]
MPLHGKIVVVKRSGGDGTEFPLTATCLFGRKPDCDIRIQLPQVSKEHCRIDLNENKEVILTNLSSVNPTRVNGEALQQSERLKHGDVITIIDRSFRFEYPPAPTPKKRSSVGGKKVVDSVTTENEEKKLSQVSADPHLKDGTNNDNIQRSLDKTLEFEAKEDDSLLQNKTTSPFNDLYQMIKKSLDVKTPRKSSVSLLQTPASRFATPRPVSVRKNAGVSLNSTEDKSTPKKNEAKAADTQSSGTPKSAKKQRKSIQGPSADVIGPEAQTTSPQRKSRATPQKFTVSEVIELVSAQSPKSPMRRRSKEGTPAKSTPSSGQEVPVRRESPRHSGKTEKVKEAPKKRKSGELGADLAMTQAKKKRVSFGSHLTPELFDKRLPPDSPLRKGAAPRRSLSLLRPKQSLLRRASAIGLVMEHEQESPAKMSTPPKKPSAKNTSAKTPSPAKKSPKSRSPSPKAATAAKKSPKSTTSSPKAATPAKKSPKSTTSSPKTATPAKKSPKSSAASPAVKSPKTKSPSPARGRSPSRNKAETLAVRTPTVKGRFSVSLINTPSPVSEDASADQEPNAPVTPKLPLKRKSMKSAQRKTPCLPKSAIKALRKSGFSRVSMSAKCSWAEIVKFGRPKVQAAAPAKKTVPKTTMMMKKKKAEPKPQTPARKVAGHASTGHADSPVTIVISRAQRQKVVHPPGAAPRLVTNIALLKKNMKMDEDLTGISEMYKTPINERKRKSVVSEGSAIKTPVGGLGTSTAEPSVLSTPEGPGEMMVSPLSVSSTVKDKRYNSEAVQRLLAAEDESSLDDIPAMEEHPESSEEQCTDLKTTTTKTPKQKLKVPECLTAVKRIMKTPRQKAEPVEDLRGRLLKTPKQKPQPQECLTGVKRIMKTPKQKAEPVEDLRGNILKTPKQKLEPQECLTGVKKIFETPQQEADPSEDLHEEPLEVSAALEAGDSSSVGVEEHVEMLANMQGCEELSETAGMKTPNVKSSPKIYLSGIKRIMKTPREKAAPVEDMVGVKRLMKTPREKAEPVDENFGIKRLVKTPRLRGAAPVEDFEGLQELMEEPLPDPTGQPETDEAEEQTSPECGAEITKELDAELDAAQEEPQDGDSVSQVNVCKEIIPNEDVPTGHNDEASEIPRIAAQPEMDEDLHKVAAADGVLPEEQAEVAAADAVMSEEQPAVKTTTEQLPDTAAPIEKKPVRGRRAKTVESEPAEDKQEVIEHTEELIVSAPTRGRRAKKAEATAPPAGRQTTRGRNAKAAESQEVELHVEESASLPSAVSLKSKRGRAAKKPAVIEVCSNQQEFDDDKSSDATETVPEAAAASTLPEPETAEATAAVVEKKSARGRRAKVAETKPAQDKQEVTDHAADPAVPAPVRGRRARKTEAAAPAPVKQTRGRNAKCQEKSFDEAETVREKSEEVTEVASETSHQAENNAAPSAEEAAVKPTRGRKTKPVLAEPPQDQEPEKTDECVTVEAQPEKSAPAVGKPRRGRKTKPDVVEQEEVSVEPPVTVETKQPPVRAKRGRSAKQEEKPENEDVVVSQEPAKRGRRTRKVEQDEVELQTTESVPEEAEAPAAPEPAPMNTPATVAAKPKRGGRKTKPDAENQPTEVPASSTTEKPKRVRRGKQATEEVEVAAVVPEENTEPEAEETGSVDVHAPVVKSTRRRGAKNEAPVVLAKRACRSTAPSVEETNPESTDLVPEPASAEPAKKGRRAATKPKAGSDAVTNDQANPTEESSSAVEDPSVSKRSVRWRSDVQVFEIPKPTPAKAVRGRKTKSGDQADVSKGASKTEEKDLSEQSVEAQPAKRARRGAKVTDAAADKEPTSQKSVEAEPRTRRGRLAKK